MKHNFFHSLYTQSLGLKDDHDHNDIITSKISSITINIKHHFPVRWLNALVKAKPHFTSATEWVLRAFGRREKRSTDGLQPNKTAQSNSRQNSTVIISLHWNKDLHSLCSPFSPFPSLSTSWHMQHRSIQALKSANTQHPTKEVLIKGYGQKPVVLCN